MIEFINLIGFSLVERFASNKDLYIYTQVVNSTISLCFTYILFSRVFLHICLDKVWKASVRYFFLTLIYLGLIFDGCLAVLYFSGFVGVLGSTWTWVLQIITYSFDILMILFVKIFYFKQRRTYETAYMFFDNLDTLVVFCYACFDIWVTPEKLTENLKLVGVAYAFVAALCILNSISLYNRSYWKCMKVYKIKLAYLVSQHKEVEIVQLGPEMQNICSQIFESAFLRRWAPSQVVRATKEVLRQHKYAEASIESICAQLKIVLMKKLMKRKSDYYFIPRPILKLLQSKLPMNLDKNVRKYHPRKEK